MPRQTYIINNFSGGVNNLKDSRDIADNESAKINGLMTDKQGVLRTSGAFVNHADGSGTLASDAGNNGDNQAGNGLFYFESDFGRKSVASTTSESGSIFGKFYPAGGSNYLKVVALYLILILLVIKYLSTDLQVMMEFIQL